MRLQRLYSNQPDVFEPISFNRALSVVLAEIRLPQNRALDTHNLGKTTVGELIDFCLLKKKSMTFFLFKNAPLFDGFVFFLELQLDDGSFLTVARAVVPGSRAAFLHSTSDVVDARGLPPEAWTHLDVPFEQARSILEGWLGFDALLPWGFRKLVGYLIRSQSDYSDVFQLGKFSGPHRDWKPFVGHLIGLPSEDVIGLYESREALETATTRLNVLTRQWGEGDADLSVIDGLIALQGDSVADLRRQLAEFDFGEADSRVTEDVAAHADNEIAALNEERYSLRLLNARLQQSLQDDHVMFRPDEAAALFEEAGVEFGDQLKRDFEQLIAFNRAISSERRQDLQTQLDEGLERAATVEARLEELNVIRSQSLDFLRETETLDKFKALSDRLARQVGDLQLLEARRASALQLLEVRREERELSELFGQFQSRVEDDVIAVGRSRESLFARLRTYFDEIVYEVLDEHALLATSINSKGGLDFVAEFVSEAGVSTSGDQGHTYRKLLCIAFDLALLRVRLDVPFPRFLYLDGALEQLDPRKQEKLIGVLRQYSRLGLQPIITALDSQLPAPVGTTSSTISRSEVVLVLHDDGDDGRLFKMPAW